MKKSSVGVGAAALLLAAALVPGGAALGAVRAGGDPRVGELQDQIGEASADESAALGQLGEIRDRRQALDAKVASFDARIADVEARIGRLQANIDRLTVRLRELDRQAAAAQAQVDTAKRRAAAAAAAMYRGEDGANAYASLFDVDNVVDAWVGTKYLSRISELRREQVDALAGLVRRIDTLHREAASQRNDIAAQQAKAQQDRREIVALRADQRHERDRVAVEEQRERELIASIRSRKDEYESQLASLQVASGTVRQLLVAHQQGEERGSSFHARRPVPGSITSSFGWRVHPILGTRRLHTGVDFHASYGQKIRAAADGYVVRAGPQGGYGNAVVIDHGGQFGTVYAHASRLLVSTGEYVHAGQVIARVGATGLASGPHLHFEVRILGVPVNPASYM